LLAGCSGDVPIPFLNLPSAPPAAGPPPEYPSLVAPAVESPDKPALLTETERARVESDLSKLPADRETAVKRRILRRN
jgi:hypothetical protein